MIRNLHRLPDQIFGERSSWNIEVITTFQIAKFKCWNLLFVNAVLNIYFETFWIKFTTLTQLGYNMRLINYDAYILKFQSRFLNELDKINSPSWRLNSLLRAIFCMVHNAVNDTVIQIIISIRSFNEVVIAGIFLTNSAFAKVICFSASLILSRTAFESKPSWTWLFRRDIIFKQFQGEN